MMNEIMGAGGLGVGYLLDTEVVASSNLVRPTIAVVVQLGERQTEDLDVAGSSPAHGIKELYYWGCCKISVGRPINLNF